MLIFFTNSYYRSKNNAVLLGKATSSPAFQSTDVFFAPSFAGDPGVGKTAIADGLAYRIVTGDVPESVVARVFSLDLGSLLATTACKSAYEEV